MFSDDRNEPDRGSLSDDDTQTLVQRTGTGEEVNINLEKIQHRFELNVLENLLNHAQNSNKILRYELRRAKEQMAEVEKKALVREERIKDEHDKRIESMERDMIRVHETYQKHIIDPSMMAMYRKYTRLANQSTGFVFATFDCMKGCQRRRVSRRHQTIKNAVWKNHVRTESSVKILYSKNKSIQRQNKGLRKEVETLQGKLRMKYQSEFQTILNTIEKQKEYINRQKEKEIEYKSRVSDLEEGIVASRQESDKQKRVIEDLKMCHRSTESKYRRLEHKMSSQNEKDIELMLFLQSCLHTLKSADSDLREKGDKVICQPTTTAERITNLIQKVKNTTNNSMDISNLSISDVMAFVSLLVNRMNMML